MDTDDDDISQETEQIGSDELLSDDSLRLPDSASPLVRLHAVRAWLRRRYQETNVAIGNAALTIQHLQSSEQPGTRLRRRELQQHQEQLNQAQQDFQDAQLRLNAYEEASELLEDSVNHTTTSERLLVEYYLTLEDLVATDLQAGEEEQSPRIQALIDVQQRVEHVGSTNEEE